MILKNGYLRRKFLACNGSEHTAVAESLPQ